MGKNIAVREHHTSVRLRLVHDLKSGRVGGGDSEVVGCDQPSPVHVQHVL